MNTITICYSTHRIETLELTERVMDDHEIIILEEPFHVNFGLMLSGNMNIGDHLLEIDVGYPKFTLAQYRLLRQLSQHGKKVLQIEPYLEHLINIQYFLADDHSPAEIKPGTVEYFVYCAEKEATGKLLEYYDVFRGNDFARILSVMNDFAKADAARFKLRDDLRAKKIGEKLIPGKNTFIEAGSLHLGLYRLLKKLLGNKWNIKIHSVDKESIQKIGGRGSLYSPGDALTLQYIQGRNFSKKRWQLFCARTLIYSIITKKNEMDGNGTDFPHTKNDLDAIQTVKKLTIHDCKILFPLIRSLLPTLALSRVKSYLNK